jgi:hypothetical protein
MRFFQRPSFSIEASLPFSFGGHKPWPTLDHGCDIVILLIILIINKSKISFDSAKASC